MKKSLLVIAMAIGFALMAVSCGKLVFAPATKMGKKLLLRKILTLKFMTKKFAKTNLNLKLMEYQ